MYICMKNIAVPLGRTLRNVYIYVWCKQEVINLMKMSILIEGSQVYRLRNEILVKCVILCLLHNAGEPLSETFIHLIFIKEPT